MMVSFCQWQILAITFLGLVGQTFALVAPVKRATVCNGRSELCGRGYGETTYLGAHNSYAVSDDIFALARTQEVDVPAQLDLGVRMLQASAHLEDDELRFCHTSCILFDGGLVVDYFRTVKGWLDAHPNEVLTFILTNPDGASLTDKWKPAFDDSGITSLVYVPPTIPTSRTSWPTLGELIDSGKHVIIFMDSGADNSVVNFILPQFDMVWEPPFSSTDPSFPCRVDRISGPLSTEEHMYMLNHNLNVDILGTGILVPDYAHADETNSVDSIIADANGCSPLAGGAAPNFVMLDFVNIGEGMQAVNRLNGF